MDLSSLEQEIRNLAEKVDELVVAQAKMEVSFGYFKKFMLASISGVVLVCGWALQRIIS